MRLSEGRQTGATCVVMGEGNWVDHAHAETLSGLFRTSCPWRLLLLLCGATAAFMVRRFCPVPPARRSHVGQLHQRAARREFGSKCADADKRCEKTSPGAPGTAGAPGLAGAPGSAGAPGLAGLFILEWLI